MKSKKAIIVLAIAMGTLLAASCSSPVTSTGTYKQAEFSFRFIVSGASAASAASSSRLLLSNAKTLTVSLFNAGSNASIDSKTVEVASSATTVSVSFSNVPYGAYTVEAIAKDASGTIVSRQTSSVSLGSEGSAPTLYLLPTNASASAVAENTGAQTVVASETLASGASRTWTIPASARYHGKVAFDLGSTSASVLVYAQDENGVLLNSSASARSGKVKSTASGAVYLTLYNSGSDATFSLSLNNQYQLFFEGGDGLSGTPFLVGDADGLNYVRNILITGLYFKQVADIDMGDFGNFTPIGSSGTPFQSTYDGNGFKIGNLMISGSGSDYQGLFGYVASGSALSNISIQNPTVYGKMYVGALAGYSAATVSSCKVVGATIVATANYVGGLIGCVAGGPISASSANASISGAIGYAGGFIGQSVGNTAIDSCSASGVMSTTLVGNVRVGGFVGYLAANSEPVSGCSSSVSVIGVMGDAKSQRVGGFVGYLDSAVVERSYCTGDVNASYFTGGFVGYIASGTISDCYTRSAVRGYTSVGGFVGSAAGGTIQYCYAANTVSNDGPGSLYGFACTSSGSLNASYWDKTVAGESSITAGSATGYTTAQMQTASNFSSTLGSTGYWTLTDGAYPKLAWE